MGLVLKDAADKCLYYSDHVKTKSINAFLELRKQLCIALGHVLFIYFISSCMQKALYKNINGIQLYIIRAFFFIKQTLFK